MEVHVTDNISLCPSNAAAAIILLEDGKYLMQMRDDKPGIFFPSHWGLFGGGIDEGESEVEALRRELQEELGIGISSPRHLMRFEFDLDSMGFGKIARSFFEVSISPEMLSDIRLMEGRSIRAFTRSEALQAHPVTPYDAFALWWHANQYRIKNKCQLQPTSH